MTEPRFIVWDGAGGECQTCGRVFTLEMEAQMHECERSILDALLRTWARLSAR